MKRLHLFLVVTPLLVMTLICWVYQVPLRMKHIYFPKGGEIVRPGDTTLIYEDDTCVRITIQHGFKGYQSGERPLLAQ